MEPCPGQPQELLTVNEQVQPPAPQNRVGHTHPCALGWAGTPVGNWRGSPGPVPHLWGWRGHWCCRCGVLLIWGAVDVGMVQLGGYPLCFGVLQVWGYQFSGLIQAQVEQPGLINH